MRALVPTGFMAQSDKPGTIVVAMCNSDRVHLIEVPNKSPKDEHREQPQTHCAFAGLASAALPSGGWPVILLPQASSEAFSPRANLLVREERWRFLPPARAPPPSV